MSPSTQNTKQYKTANSVGGYIMTAIVRYQAGKKVVGALGGGVLGQLPAHQQAPPPPPQKDAYLQIVAMRGEIAVWSWAAVMIFFLVAEEKAVWSEYHQSKGNSKEFAVNVSIIETLQTKDPGPHDGENCRQWMTMLVKVTLQAMPPNLGLRNVFREHNVRDMRGVFQYLIDKYLAADDVEQAEWKAALYQSYSEDWQFFQMMGILFQAFIKFHTAGPSSVGGAGAAARDNM